MLLSGLLISSLHKCCKLLVFSCVRFPHFHVAALCSAGFRVCDFQGALCSVFLSRVLTLSFTWMKSRVRFFFQVLHLLHSHSLGVPEMPRSSCQVLDCSAWGPMSMRLPLLPQWELQPCSFTAAYSAWFYEEHLVPSTGHPHRICLHACAETKVSTLNFFFIFKLVLSPGCLLHQHLISTSGIVWMLMVHAVNAGPTNLQAVSYAQELSYGNRETRSLLGKNTKTQT